MHTLLRASLVIAVTSTLFACKPKPAPEQVAEAESAESESAVEETSSVDNTMIEACEISMSGPESHEWTTYWNTASSASPSSARSIYWADEDEKALLLKRSVPTPLTIQCSSNESPKISVSMTAPTSREEDVPLAAGQFGIVGKGTAPLPRQFQVATISVGDRRFEAASGTLQLSGFDSYGVRGSFQIQGAEAGEDGEAFTLEGTFDIPCRGGPMEGECDANAAVSRN